jgi:hypothetical protein
VTSQAQALKIVAPVAPRELSLPLGVAPVPVTDYQQLTVIVPTLNEAGNIGELLDELLQHYPGLQILVADDDSTDGPREAVMAPRASTRGFACCGVEASLAGSQPACWMR